MSDSLAKRLRDCAAEVPSDNHEQWDYTMVQAAEALEAQAAEIERLTRDLESAQQDRANFEYAMWEKDKEIERLTAALAAAEQDAAIGRGMLEIAHSNGFGSLTEVILAAKQDAAPAALWRHCEKYGFPHSEVVEQGGIRAYVQPYKNGRYTVQDTPAAFRRARSAACRCTRGTTAKAICVSTPPATRCCGVMA